MAHWTFSQYIIKFPSLREHNPKINKYTSILALNLKLNSVIQTLCCYQILSLSLKTMKHWNFNYSHLLTSAVKAAFHSLAEQKHSRVHFQCVRWRWWCSLLPLAVSQCYEEVYINLQDPTSSKSMGAEVQSTRTQENPFPIHQANKLEDMGRSDKGSDNYCAQKIDTGEIP